MKALIIVGAALIGLFLIMKKRAKPEPPIINDISGVLAGAPEKKAKFSVGESLHHIETGQKIVIINVPSIVDGEYTIEWPSGATGEIHETQLVSWFSR